MDVVFQGVGVLLSGACLGTEQVAVYRFGFQMQQNSNLFASACMAKMESR